ncbi:MAG: tRNA (adenosine(37)-N6)-dimethylallyltransferase MiaA, partial [Alphaproteobacteria bacterium]|nr:tRNA (adenosine(37)-N6)-dimethylallyltransferase MiaA [Alphaproteobacteria bacterium]
MVSTANSCEKKEQLLCSANSPKNKVIVIGGATASGKSGLALRLAEKLNGVVINADSMQVYKDVPTLTARPSEAEQQSIPHRLYGFLEPDENYSVFKWVKAAATEIRQIWRENKVPVIVGGTGFYLQTLIKGISPVPQVKDETRAEVRKLFERLGYEAFLNDFQKKDPSFTFTDPQRVLRAAEVLEETGKSVTYWQSLPLEKEIESDFLSFLTDLPRE